MSSIPGHIEPAQFEAIFQGYPPLQLLLAMCRERGLPVYLVGGAVRDLLYRGILSKDLDVVVPPEAAKELAQALARELDAKFITLDEGFHIYRVIILPSVDMIDVAGCIGPGIEADLRRRDLTVNAMAYHFQTGELLDPLNGRADLEQGCIRMVSEQNMLEDPLRLLRIFRLGAELGFTQIDPATLDVVRRHGERLLRAAPDRIHYELMKMLSADRCFHHVRLMGETRLLEHIFPELSPMHSVPANNYHHLGLFDHTLELLNQAEIHFPDLPQAVQDYLKTDVNPFTRRLAMVRLACLMHDAGKPATMQDDPKAGRQTFYGHDEVSELLTYGVSLRLKWGREITRIVAGVVRWHLYPGDMLRPDVTPKAHRRFFRRVAEFWPELLLLAIADRYSARGPAVSSQDLDDQKAGLIKLWGAYQAHLSAEEVKRKLLTGREIMNLLGIGPGPQVGQILEALSEAELNGELTTHEEAVMWVKARFGSSTTT